jgi:soluble lytic murein transglycosylase
MNSLLFLFFAAGSLVHANSALSDHLSKSCSLSSPNATAASIVSAGTLHSEQLTSSPIDELETNLIELKRGLFSDAVAALETGQLDNFAALKAQSTDYILYPYLEYYDIRNRLSSTSDEELMTFINTYDTTPLSYRLRTQWLYRLAEDKRWDQYLKVYKGQGGAKLRCALLDAKLSTDNSKATLKSVLNSTKSLWLTGKDAPAECENIFDKFEKSKLLTGKIIWDRIELAMEKGNTKLAQTLSERLSSRDRKKVEMWIKVHKNPRKYLSSTNLRKNNLVVRKILVHGIKRLARQDAEDAKILWAKIKHRRGFGRSELAEIDKYIALRASYQSHPKAYDWLMAVRNKSVDDDVRYWRAMTALRLQNWKALMASIKQLPANEKSEPKWKYWKARASEKLKDTEVSSELFKEIAKETNYYGFLASDRLGIPYTFNAEALVRDAKEIQLIAEIPGVQRAHELFRVGLIDEARREWAQATRNFKTGRLKQATILAHDWGWHHNAISTIAKTPHRQDYDIRFPTPFRELVFDNADNHDLDPSLIYGVARRESAFRVNARSSVGALGLMQLMPGTARLESKRLGRKKPTSSDILVAENNIFLGSSYLNRLLQRFGGNQALATAAYNAGPRRVDSWIPKSEAVSSDIWVDTLPFKETREYVRAVLAYSTIFDWKLDKKTTLISSRMYSEISKEALAQLTKAN